MKVLCSKVVSSTTGEPMESSPWLHVDRVYVVLAIEVSPGRRIDLRIVGDDGDVPALYDSDMFITVSSDIPSNWVATLRDGGRLVLAPHRWHEPGFWEAYFDRDPSAVSVYEQERDKILGETG